MGAAPDEGLPPGPGGRGGRPGDPDGSACARERGLPGQVQTSGQTGSAHFHTTEVESSHYQRLSSVCNTGYVEEMLNSAALSLNSLPCCMDHELSLVEFSSLF